MSRWILSNLSDEQLSQLISEAYAEKKRRFLRNIGSAVLVHDKPELKLVERIRYIRDNNPTLSLIEAKWYVER